MFLKEQNPMHVKNKMYFWHPNSPKIWPMMLHCGSVKRIKPTPATTWLRPHSLPSQPFGIPNTSGALLRPDSPPLCPLLRSLSLVFQSSGSSLAPSPKVSFRDGRRGARRAHLLLARCLLMNSPVQETPRRSSVSSVKHSKQSCATSPARVKAPG